MPRPLILRLVPGLLALVLLLPPALVWQPAGAQASIAADDAKRKINLAGRQRMLSQRIAMQACMSDTGILPDQTLSRARAAADLFDRTLAGLRNGDAAQGLLLEQNAEVLEALRVVDGLWMGYEASIDRFLDRKVLSALRQIHARNGAILVNMNAAVGIMEGVYGAGLVSPRIATALNIAGRQRMLLMKTLKEACMAGRGLAPEEDRKALARTLSLFQLSHFNLREGNEMEGIIAPPSFEIEMQLELVQDIWDWMQPHLAEIAAGGAVRPEQLEALLYHVEVALPQMNAAVGMYENYE